jgi:hypothetical protein
MDRFLFEFQYVLQEGGEIEALWMEFQGAGFLVMPSELQPLLSWLSTTTSLDEAVIIGDRHWITTSIGRPIPHFAKPLESSSKRHRSDRRNFCAPFGNLSTAWLRFYVEHHFDFAVVSNQHCGLGSRKERIARYEYDHGAHYFKCL